MKIWFSVVLVLLIGFELLFCENILDKVIRIWSTGSISMLGFYLLSTLVGFFAISMIFFIRQKILYGFFLLFLIVTYMIELIYKNINSYGFSLNDLAVAEAEADSFAIDALRTYSDALESTALILIVFIAVTIFLRKIVHKNQFYISLKLVIPFFVVASFLSFYLFYRTLGYAQARPSSLKVSTVFSFYFTNSLYYGERDKLKERVTDISSYKNIILIVDESIGGKYLSINGYEKETTPYLKSIQNRYRNLGLASSAANCSDSSNILLMTGAQLNSMPDSENSILKMPSLFQYAKNAGYRTSYISGQGLNMELQNHMTKYDLSSIDEFLQPKEYGFKSMPEEHIILKTKELLGSSDKNFIFIVKLGAHFHWERTYPSSAKYFNPTLTKEDALSLDNKERALNSYQNSIRYSVDDFFKAFLTETLFFDRDDTLIIYTSDHGQSILEKGTIATHCSSTNPPLSQGTVPLLLFAPKEDKLINEFPFQKDIYSHYEIGPTIKKFMGYEVKDKTLFEISKDNSEQKFASGDIFGRSVFYLNDLNR